MQCHWRRSRPSSALGFSSSAPSAAGSTPASPLRVSSGLRAAAAAGMDPRGSRWDSEDLTAEEQRILGRIRARLGQATGFSGAPHAPLATGGPRDSADATASLLPTAAVREVAVGASPAAAATATETTAWADATTSPLETVAAGALATCTAVVQVALQRMPSAPEASTLPPAASPAPSEVASVSGQASPRPLVARSLFGELSAQKLPPPDHTPLFSAPPSPLRVSGELLQLKQQEQQTVQLEQQQRQQHDNMDDTTGHPAPVDAAAGAARAVNSPPRPSPPPAQLPGSPKTPPSQRPSSQQQVDAAMPSLALGPNASPRVSRAPPSPGRPPKSPAATPRAMPPSPQGNRPPASPGRPPRSPMGQRALPRTPPRSAGASFPSTVPVMSPAEQSLIDALIQEVVMEPPGSASPKLHARRPKGLALAPSPSQEGEVRLGRAAPAVPLVPAAEDGSEEDSVVVASLRQSHSPRSSREGSFLVDALLATAVGGLLFGGLGQPPRRQQQQQQLPEDGDEEEHQQQEGSPPRPVLHLQIPSPRLQQGQTASPLPLRSPLRPPVHPRSSPSRQSPAGAQGSPAPPGSSPARPRPSPSQPAPLQQQQQQQPGQVSHKPPRSPQRKSPTPPAQHAPLNISPKPPLSPHSKSSAKTAQQQRQASSGGELRSEEEAGRPQSRASPASSGSRHPSGSPSEGPSLDRAVRRLALEVIPSQGNGSGTSSPLEDRRVGCWAISGALRMPPMRFDNPDFADWLPWTRRRMNRLHLPRSARHSAPAGHPPLPARRRAAVAPPRLQSHWPRGHGGGECSVTWAAEDAHVTLADPPLYRPSAEAVSPSLESGAVAGPPSPPLQAVTSLLAAPALTPSHVAGLLTPQQESQKGEGEQPMPSSSLLVRNPARQLLLEQVAAPAPAASPLTASAVIQDRWGVVGGRPWWDLVEEEEQEQARLASNLRESSGSPDLDSSSLLVTSAQRGI